jgi:hypothetical protein
MPELVELDVDDALLVLVAEVAVAPEGSEEHAASAPHAAMMEKERSESMLEKEHRRSRVSPPNT